MKTWPERKKMELEKKKMEETAQAIHNFNAVLMEIEGTEWIYDI